MNTEKCTNPNCHNKNCVGCTPNMNTKNTYNVEEVVEEFRNAHPSGLFVDCGFDAPFYQPVFEEEVRWLRTALQSAHAEGVKAGRERIPNYQIIWDTDKQTGEICVLLFEINPDGTKRLMQEINTAMGSATTGRIAINPKFALSPQSDTDDKTNGL